MTPYEKFEDSVRVIDPQTAADEYRLLHPVGSFDVIHVTPERIESNNKVNPGAVLINYQGDQKWLPKSVIAIDSENNLYILNDLFNEYL